MARDLLVGLAPFPATVRETGSTTVLVADVTLKQSASAGAAYTLSADAGSFALTGGSITLNRLQARHLVLAGQPTPVIITESANRQAIIGNVLYTERTPTNSFSMLAERGAFVLTGYAADMSFSGAFEPDAGTFLFSGNDARLLRGRSLIAQTGVFSLAMASVLAQVDAFSGAFTLGSGETNLVYGSVSTKLIAAGGTFSLGGQGAGFHWNLSKPSEAGAFILTGGDATFAIGNRSLTAEAGLFVLDGRPTGNRLSAHRGVFALVGVDVNLEVNADTFWSRVEDTAEIWTKVSL